MSWLGTWWLWIAGALVFAILETLAPVFIFLGLGTGALAVGLALLAGLGLKLGWMLVLFAGVSLIATLALRALLGTRRDEVKTFTDDING